MCIVSISFHQSNSLTTHYKMERMLVAPIRRHGRGLPKAVTSTKLKKQGDSVQKQKGNPVATAWHDKRTVTLTSVRRRRNTGKLRTVPCPSAVKTYTEHMNGVDRADQLRSS